MNNINYGLIDSLSKLAQNPSEWKKTYGNLTLLQVLGIRTGVDATTIQHGESAKVYSGVHGKYCNLVKLAPAKCTTGVEKKNSPKRIVIIRKKDGTVSAKRKIGKKWCNSNSTKIIK